MKTIKRYNKRSIRLKEYDYSHPGEYFITICTFNHECSTREIFENEFEGMLNTSISRVKLGEIVDGEMRLNKIGKIVKEEWLRTANIRSGIELDVFIIMPNHIHGIIVIEDESPILNVGTHSCASLQRKPRSLGSIIAGFKSAATKRINEMRHTPSFPVWQSRYYDRIIRNEKELNNIREYIQNNPLKWVLDEENPMKFPHNKD